MRLSTKGVCVADSCTVTWDPAQVSDFWEGGFPVSVKGKIFDTRFGLIHVQTGKKFFVEGPPLPQ